MGELFLTLLNRSITAGWLVLAILAVRFLFRKMPKWISCLLWGAVAIRLLAPFSIESAFSLQPSAEPIQFTSEIEGEMYYLPLIDSNSAFVENRVNPLLRDTFFYEGTESVAPLQIVTEIAGAIWAGGMILFIVFAIVSTLKLHHSVRESICYRENIYLCDGVATPFILGIIRPKIYLPSTLEGNEMEYILAHEKAHLQRLDYIWKPVGYLLLCVYWFNPLLIFAYFLLCKDIELACDEKVIKDMEFSEKKEYSRVLLSCAVQKKFVLTCPLSFGEVGVKDRVRTILNYKKTATGVTIVAVLFCIVLAVCFLTNPAKAANTETDADIYGKVVKELGDHDTYALLAMNYAYPVLLTSDQVYDEGTEKQAAISCDVYYCGYDGAKFVGTILSDGTAYPITFTKDGIFAASGHKIEKYGISKEGILYLQRGIYEQFDEEGNVTYTRITGSQEKESTEQEYQKLLEEYGESQMVHFSYGAEDSVNEYRGK